MPGENELNVASLAESVSTDIFGAGAQSEGEPSVGEVVEQPVLSGQPEQNASPSPAPAPVSKFALPKAWKKEKEALWNALPEEAREYLTSREQDMVKGLDQYSSSHKNWSKLVEPFQPLLQENPGVDPIQLMQNLLHNHINLLRATGEQKKAMAQKLIQHYGLSEFIGGNQAQPSAPGGNQAQPPSLPPEVAQALQKLGPLEQGVMSLQQALQAQKIAEQQKIVEAFASDPKNKFFSEVEDDILRLLQTGAADSLERAYEMAIWANPAVRQKVLQDQAQASSAQGKKAILNVEASGEGTPKKPKPATINDTIDEVAKRLYNTH